MTRIEMFNKMMSTAKIGGYFGDDYRNQVGFIIDGQNISSLMFDSTFNSTLFKDAGERVLFLNRLSLADDKWSFIKSNFKQLKIVN